MKVIEFRELDVDSIRISDWAERRVIKDHEVEDLAESIRRGIQIEPIIVRRLDDGSYELISGYMRLNALKRLGYRTVEAKIVECSDEEALTISLEENLKRSDMHPFDIARKVAYMYEALGLSVYEIGRRLNKEHSWVSMMLRLDAISPEAKNLLAQKVRDIPTLYEVSKLDKPGEQVFASEIIVRHHFNRRGASSLVKDIREKGLEAVREEYKRLLEESETEKGESLYNSRMVNMLTTSQEYKGFSRGEAHTSGQPGKTVEFRTCYVCEETRPREDIRFIALCREEHEALDALLKLCKKHECKKVEKVLEPIVENLDIFLSYPEDQQGEVIYNLIELARMVRGLDLETIRELVEEAKKSHA